MKNSKLIASIFIGALLLTGCGGGGGSDTPAAAETPAPSSTETAAAPAYQVLGTTTITTTGGQTIQVDKTEGGFIFHGYEGKIVLLEVYGDTCPHCIAAIPSYNALQARYPNDVVVIALESYGTLTNASKQQYLTVPKANTGEMFPFIKDLTGYGLQAVPYLMMMNRDGNIFYEKVLADFPESEIDAQIKNFL